MKSELQSTLRPLYNEFGRDLVQDHLPNKYRVLAGVAVRDHPLFDVGDTFPDYKRGLIDAIHATVDEGDHVELVGFGRAVSTIHCFRAGASRVTAYEASREMIDIAETTLETNYYPDGDLVVRHALVGDAIDVYGDFGDAEVISPEEIGNADVLVLDCEGAEQSILNGLKEFPRDLVVETHPERGVRTDATLDELGDEIEIDLLEYEPVNPKGKKVIVGRNSEADRGLERANPTI